jgi:PAS domain-containing protein
MGVELQRYLDSLPAPIVVVDPEGTIKTANDKTREMLGKELVPTEGYKRGVVFEYRFARLPEGCGNTMHCSACTIRRSVMETFAMGKSNARVPACLNQENSERSREVCLLISTEKVEDVVLLQIDEIR